MKMMVGVLFAVAVSVSAQTDCGQEIRQLNSCLASAGPEERGNKKAAKDACFTSNQCAAPVHCMKEALESSGLIADLESCAADLGLTETGFFMKMLKGGKGRRGGRRGRRGGRRGNDDSQRDAKILEACGGNEDAAAQVDQCLQGLRGGQGQGQGGQGGQGGRGRFGRGRGQGGQGNSPKDCIRAVNSECRAQLMQSMCACFTPKYQDAREDLVSALQSCPGDDADEMANPDHILEKVCSTGGRGGRRGGGRRGGRGRGGRGRGQRG